MFLAKIIYELYIRLCARSKSQQRLGEEFDGLIIIVVVNKEKYIQIDKPNLMI